MMISTNHSTIIFSYMNMGNSYDNHLTRVTMGNWMMSTNHTVWCNGKYHLPHVILLYLNCTEHTGEYYIMF